MNSEDRLTCQDLDNHLARQTFNSGVCFTGCAEELSHSDYDVIFENLALLEQTHMSARHFDNSEDMFAQFDSTVDREADDLALVEQIGYPFAFI